MMGNLRGNVESTGLSNIDNKIEHRKNEPRIFSRNVCIIVHAEYPLVNIQKTMENHHFEWENSLFQPTRHSV
jgi:hypothetical protein